MTALATIPAAWFEAIHALRQPDVKPKAPQRRQGVHLAGDRLPHREALKQLVALMESPLFAWAQEHAEDVTFSVWIGLATQLATVVKDHADLEKLACRFWHEVCAEDPARYRPRVADRTWQDALRHGKPTSWAAMDGVPDDLIVPGSTNPVHAIRQQLRRQHP